MPDIRDVRPPPLSLRPRSSIDGSQYRSIDSVLKDLQGCSRRLQVVFTAHGDELKILERLYYKGKNQHRSSLYWKRVMEIRRYGHRLDHMAIPAMIGRLRASFFGEKGTLKGAWVSAPDASSIRFTMDRMRSCTVLVEKMQDRLFKAYNFFALALQSGAFIQLVLTLTAIMSRMYALIPGIRASLLLGWTICHRVLQIFDPAQAQSIKVPNSSRVLENENVVPSATMVTEQYSNDHTMKEDTGLPIARQLLETKEDLEVETTPLGALKITLSEDEDILLGMDVADQNKGASIVPIIRDDVLDTSLRDHGDTPGVKVGGRDSGSKKKNTKRRKRDEIDEIFGF